MTTNRLATLAVSRKTAPKKTTAQALNKPAALRKTSTALRVYQIYFDAAHLQELDPFFTPLSNENHPDPLREFAVFERLCADKSVAKLARWGALSWRFGKKTGLTGDALALAINNQPGFDLYYCNPFPEHEALFSNGWQQGVTAHPSFFDLCSAVFKASGLDVAALKRIQPSGSFSACNYFIGSPAFWSSYVPWVRGVLDRARANLPESVLKVLDSPLSDPRNLHAASSYWPFIIERLLPEFLRSAGQALTTHKLTLPTAQGRLNSHLLRLREMKDVAQRSRSPWLYACWLNYRNLYLQQSCGADWCKHYLPLISPTEADFG